MFGKWHLGDNYPYRPEDRGFEEVYRHGGGGVGQTPDVWNNSYFDGAYFHNGKIEKAKGFCTDVFFQKAHEFIKKKANSNEPFLAYISTNAPHGPLHCPQKYLNLYKDQKAGIAAFFGMITNIDDNVGKTRKLLVDLGIENNTIFIFTTDNGTASGRTVFNAGMRGQKGSEYDGGHRVPMFIHWPAGGINEHRKIDTLCHAIDLVPTLLDVCEVKNAAKVKFDGTTLKDLIAPEISINWPDRMIITDSQRVVDPIKWRKSAVMSQRYRLVNGEELYDIKTDPGQEKNISKENPNQVAKMRAFYDQWWTDLEPSFAQTTEIQLGHPDHPKVTMTAHDWLNTGPPWHQGMIRGAKGGEKPKFNGHWAIKVLEEGIYKVSLLRWPEEAKHPINATLPPGSNVPGASKAFRTTKGVSIKATAAALLLNGKEIARKPVGKKEIAISFTTKLIKGSHAIAPIFRSPKGETGAFYCIIEKQP
jgi:arylsulfatase B